MFKKILVPLDGSPEANVALPLARTMATSTHATMTLLRVVARPALPEHHETVHRASEGLQRIAAELANSGLEVQPVIREGEPAEEIVRLTHDSGADLVVMRTHGRAGFERAVLGSVTEEVLTRSDAPVLLLRPGGRRITHIGKLLVPVDGSPGGALALGTAMQLAKTSGASIAILEVVVPIPMQIYAAYDYSGMAFYDTAWDDDALAGARSYVDGVATWLRRLGLSVDAEARMAPGIPDTIAGAADESSADLIVMSTQALTGPARALLGSVADAVVRSSHCPVLLIHRAETQVERAEVTGSVVPLKTSSP